MMDNVYLLQPVFTNKIRDHLFQQQHDGTLGNPKLWDEIEFEFVSTHYDEDQTLLETAHFYWVEEILTPSQRSNYPFTSTSRRGRYE